VAFTLFKRKLKKQERLEVEQQLNGLSFSCGTQLQDSDLLDHLKEVVFTRKLACEDPVKKLYYSDKYEDICVYCSGPVDLWSDTEMYYPQCKGCEDRENTKYKNEQETLIAQYSYVLVANFC